MGRLKNLGDVGFQSFNILQPELSARALDTRQGVQKNSSRVRNVQTKFYTPNLTKGKVEWNAIILRSTPTQYPIVSSAAQKTIESNSIGGVTGRNHQYYLYKVMIPELTSYLPFPTKLSTRDLGIHQAVINTYPTAYSLQGKNHGLLHPGAIVRIQFEQNDITKRPIIVATTGRTLTLVDEERLHGDHWYTNRNHTVKDLTEGPAKNCVDRPGTFTGEDCLQWYFPANIKSREWIISSPMGRRKITGVCKMHAGLDIGPSTSHYKYRNEKQGWDNDYILEEINKGNVDAIEIRAMADGIVRWVSRGPQSPAGNAIGIYHPEDKSYTTYMHLALPPASPPGNPVRLKKGDEVSGGDNIGIMGTTGTSSGIHLHLETHAGIETAPASRPIAGRKNPKGFMLDRGLVFQPQASYMAAHTPKYGNYHRCK